MPISAIGAAHVAAALSALTFGGLVIAMRKGTPLHRAMGMGYAAAMVALCVTALMIYRTTGHFGPFHFLALASLATIIIGVAAVARGKISRHYQMMSYSYLGLLSAAVTQLLISLPALHWPFRGSMTGIGSAVVFLAIGRIILPRLQHRVLGTIEAD
jgi:uncharacterized membrane protein